MTNLFYTTALLIPKLQGWCSIEKAHAFVATVMALRPEVSVEIGVFGGRSLFPIAMAHKETGRGKVIAIDPWLPAASAAGQSAKDQEWWGKVDHDALYKEFIEQLEKLALGHVVEVHRKRSNDVKPPPLIDFLHIDGNHGEQAFRDAERFGLNVRTGGMCFMDDLDWNGGAVRKGAAYLQSIGFKELYKQDTGAMFQRL